MATYRILDFPLSIPLSGFSTSPSGGTFIAFEVTLADGSPLPSPISFDEGSRSIQVFTESSAFLGQAVQLKVGALLNDGTFND